MMRSTIFNIHNKIMESIESIAEHIDIEKCIDQSILSHNVKLESYKEHAASYLASNNVKGYSLFISNYGIINSINSISYRTGWIKRMELMIPKKVRKCVCGGCLIDTELSIECETCGLVFQTNSCAKSLYLNTSVSKLEQKMKQLDKHLDRIQGFKTTDISEDIIEEAKSDIKKICFLSILKWLKKNKYHRYLPDINYIIYCLTGYRPPLISKDEVSMLKNRFKLLCEGCEDIEPNRSISYRFIIFKMIDCLFEKSDRTTEILGSISLPAPKTVIKLDKRFERLCDHVGLDNIVYRPTIRIPRVSNY